ncbi:UDP-N-acetylmuramoyl-tripeptide--D-alanyl-D-alanine ligase [Deinococcus metallilatus]|uniref:UDP-N-acetylmuramoyl-tripeptide--D-alanyl-D-alanine ligase n=1 Tax=Deinococcus metallilatus TaxID=1211322 RepID=A0AAJ5F632_9DEIO|nr:UDP-N-acetylmuramoyl-tripeptide--D-alanyl-D-alanine ligase [Deinococcus metallilatus]MBB5294767.1 UDP-N-acetylmuramoyl-tripeptide--D-alanyl-D-alanine ligase [Deinococcus metallilatus]QBY09508.1 UDP-N-acetylmuramoyl-tripeptide--D-alanyl-D-alanine ligase [Deinococcus metallilatus]RXJ09513.1 UDP-N-acetylmuramoyl-tripeptide--D-alanyl-D-alanine ligase [Deinococcus metallilatus]TLK29035.1 UDP-N-acetylmuramoyl-tripeptide--D-alanyl-D-alanine ligase [Deinococcus metallilatus]GMA16693.1 UDP-N-acetylm
MLDPHAALPFAAHVHPDARPAARLTWDSREASPEVAFVALPGEKMHGNRFVEAALAAGAPFVLTNLDVERAVRAPDAREALFAWARAERAKNPLVVGITGSVGKTTAKSYAAAALGAHFMPVYNTMPAIACFLIEFGGSGVPLVVEMGIDRVGEMAELVDLVRPDVGVVTSVGAAHLEQLGSVEGVAREKGVILEGRRGLVGTQAAPFYPGTDTYGFGEGVTFSGEGLTVTPEGAHFTFRGVPVTLPLASRVQAEAAVLGLALALEAGVPLAKAAARLSQVQVPGGRYRVHPGRFTVIDDAYNASPLAVTAALDALAAFPGRRISVLGRMLELGETERDLHAQVGAHARERADLTYGVGAFAAELGERAYRTVPELLEGLLAEVRDGDVVLVKASRGISWTPDRRAQEGVGLDVVVEALLRERSAVSGQPSGQEEAQT